MAIGQHADIKLQIFTQSSNHSNELYLSREKKIFARKKTKSNSPSIYFLELRYFESRCGVSAANTNVGGISPHSSGCSRCFVQSSPEHFSAAIALLSGPGPPGNFAFLGSAVRSPSKGASLKCSPANGKLIITNDIPDNGELGNGASPL